LVACFHFHPHLLLLFLGMNEQQEIVMHVSFSVVIRRIVSGGSISTKIK
jgi:hypothetical protein